MKLMDARNLASYITIMQPILVYTTFPDVQVTENTCTQLLEEGLIACANIFPKMISVYKWEGNITREEEFAAKLEKMTDEEWKERQERRQERREKWKEVCYGSR